METLYIQKELLLLKNIFFDWVLNYKLQRGKLFLVIKFIKQYKRN